MALEIRPYTEEETKAAQRIAAIVFGNRSSTPDPNADANAFRPEWSLCAFEDGEMATTYGAYPFTLRLNGGKTPAAGVTFVGTLPWYRRRGHLRQIMETDFKRRYEQRMEPIAILLASIAAIYQRYGYAVCSSRVAYSIDPRWIRLVPSLAAPRGRLREVSPDELPLLQTLYRQFTAPRNGYLHRSMPVVWDQAVLGRGPQMGGGPPFGPSLLSIYEEDGVPLGYVAYATKHFENFEDGAGPGQRLLVRDSAWLTPGAYHAMWEHFSKFDLVTRVVMPNAPADDPAFDLLLDPRELHSTRYDWLLGRIIDVERALPLRPYGEGRVVFDVADAMCPWNAGRWALEAGPEGASITRTTESPSLTLDVSALAQLVFGQVSPSLAVRIGRAEAAPDSPLPLWDAMFHTAYAPFCPDGF